MISISNFPTKKSYSTIVGAALYLANDMSQVTASKIMENYGNCTEVSIRSLCKIVRMKKKARVW